MSENIYFYNDESIENFVPYMTPNGPEGEVHWIRESGNDGLDLTVSIWRCPPGFLSEPFPVTFAGTETLYGIEGTLHIEEVSNRRKYKVTKGTVITVEKGTETIWDVEDGFKALMVIAGEEDQA